MKLVYDKNRVAEARDLRTRWYNGEKIERLPFTFAVNADTYNSWMGGNPYNFYEMCTDNDKAVMGQLKAMQHQFSTYPDCDYLPVFNMYHLGEGVLASMFGAKQLIAQNDPPYTDGRILKNIYEIDKLPKRIDVENSEWGKRAKEQVLKFVDATNGEIPVAVIDYQSTYGTATKLLPNEELILAMYDEPELVHQLFAQVTQGIIDLIETMKKWVGADLLALNSNNPIPNQSGIIMWDDYISVITPELFKEFAVPYNIQIFEKFGYGHLHTCGPYFPGFLDACISCKPRSLDASIMRGMGKSKKDLLEFRRITKEHNITLFGDIQMNEQSIFNAEKTKPDEDMLFEFVKDRYMLSYWGTADEGKEYKKLVDRLNKRMNFTV